MKTPKKIREERNQAENEMKRDKSVLLATALCTALNSGSHRSLLGQHRACRDEDKTIETTQTASLKYRNRKCQKSRYFLFITMETAQPCSFKSQRSQGHWHF